MYIAFCNVVETCKETLIFKNIKKIMNYYIGISGG